ncbi:MAG: tetratricopeptide repeat protein [Pacificimonas sp.]
MKLVSQLALGVALAFGGVTVAALPASPAVAQEEAYQPKYSRAVQKNLGPAQAALDAGDYATFDAEIAEATSKAKSADDRFIIASLKLQKAQKLSDDAATEAGLREILASNSEAITPQRRASFIQALGSLAVQRDDNAAAQQYFQQLADLQPNNSEAVFNVGVMALRAGDSQTAYDSMVRAIQLKEAEGVTPEKAWYSNALKLAFENEMDIVAPSVALVRAYPEPENWRSALTLFRDGAGFDDDGNLDVFRLMADTNSLEGERDYIEYAETANMRGFRGEARAALDAGLNAGQVTADKTYVKDLDGMIDGQLADERSELDSLARESASEANGKLAHATGVAFLGHGQNDRAAEMFRLALDKGDVDVADVQTRLGIALLRGGEVEEARTAFETVDGSAADEALANFWLLHLELAHGGSPDAAATVSG